MFPRLELKRCPSMDTLSKGGRHFAWRLTSKALPADTIWVFLTKTLKGQFVHVKL
jgi:hypothetical protein